MFSGKCKSKARLDGRTAVVTGANTGIGKETAREFYRIGIGHQFSYLRVIVVNDTYETTRSAAAGRAFSNVGPSQRTVVHGEDFLGGRARGNSPNSLSVNSSVMVSILTCGDYGSA